MSIPPFLASELVRNAVLAGTLAAVLAGLAGYFVVLRQLSFVGHALGHIGFAGAAGAGLVGLSPWAGQLLLTVLAAAGMGLLSERLSGRDVAIGVILAFSLGLGMLFLHFYTAYAGQIMSVLFGNLLGVANSQLKSMLIWTLPGLAALLWMFRPLLFASLEPELAEAKGLSLRLLSTGFLVLTAIAVVAAAQAVGVLLIFTLLVGPAAAALNWSRSPLAGAALSVCLAVLTVWLGLLLSFLTDWPIPFWISALSLAVFLLSLRKGVSLIG